MVGPRKVAVQICSRHMPDSSLRDIFFIAEYVASFLYRPEKVELNVIVNVTDIPILFQPYWYNSLTFWTDLARRHDWQ